MARQGPRVRFAAATAATQVFATLTAAGWPVPPWVLTILEDVREGRGTAASFKASALRLDVEGQRNRKWIVGSLEQKYYWAIAGAERVCWLASSGVDNLQDTLNQLSYALAKPELLERWYADALKSATHLPAKAKAVRVVKPSPAETVALARIAKALGKHGSLVAKRGARFDPRGTASAPVLKKLLARKKYPVHASVLAFERTYGGLAIPGHGADVDWRTAGPFTLVGAYASVRSKDEHEDGGRPDLVPIAYTPNDGILFLDAKGVPWGQDTIEDPVAVKMRMTVAGAVAKLFRWS